MAKFAVLFVAAIAFQAAFAGSNEDWQREQRKMEWMAKKIQDVSNDVAGLIQNAKTDTNQGRRALMTETNEFAHHIQDVVYNLQRAAQNTQGEEAKKLKEKSIQLTDVVYASEQAMNNAEPNQMKTQLKTQMQTVAAEAQKMSQQFKDAQNAQDMEESTRNAMKRAMWDIHATICRLQAHAQHQDKTMQEISTEMQTMAGQMSMYTQNVNCDSEQTADDLADWVQQLSQMINNMVDKLQREADNQEGETRNLMQQVANRMSEMRSELERTANTQGNRQERCGQLKNQLNRLRDVATLAQRLMEAAQKSGDEEGQGAKAVIKNVMLDVMAACRTMQMQLQMMAEQRN